MNYDAGKKAAAYAALRWIEEDTVVGVGTGSTVSFFIEALKTLRHKIEGAVASSNATAELLRAAHIPLFDLNAVNDLPVYVDGADEINAAKQMIKGGGGALAKEKVIATVAKKFICIADQSKKVEILGAFPVAVEVLPIARSYVARQIVQLGGDPVYRENFITDNGNIILDVFNLSLFNPLEMEIQIKKIIGVVENGIFARRIADVVLLGDQQNVTEEV